MKSVIELIKKCGNIIILAHENEDADAIGSCYAMRLALLGMGKKAEVYLSDDIIDYLGFMGRDYRLFDAENVPTCDLCLCLDCADLERTGKRKAIFDNALHTACIDHHKTNPGFAEVNYVEWDAPATGEIIYNMLLEMGVSITREIAKNLYAAISTDTGSFAYSNVRPATMRIVANLLETGIDHAEISRLLYDTHELETIRYKGKLMESIQRYIGGKLCVVLVKKKELLEYGVSERDANDVVNIPRAVKGCEIAVSIREAEDKIKLSFRSNGKYTVSDIAEHFGGGGHAMAAGASQSGKTLDEVLEEVIKVCEEVING